MPDPRNPSSETAPTADRLTENARSSADQDRADRGPDAAFRLQPTPAQQAVLQRHQNMLYAAAMLYAAHKEVTFDGEDDKQIQAALLAKAAELCPELRALADSL